jgi:hypothetical protein
MAYPNSGKLSPNKFKNNDPKKPDVTGELIMQRSALLGLLKENQDEEIVIKLSGWKRQGNFGHFLSISWNNYKKKDDGARPTQRQFPASDSEDIPF